MSPRQVVRSHVQVALLAAAALMLAPRAATAQCRPNCRGYESYQPCPRCQPYQPHYAPQRPDDLPEPKEPGKKEPGAKEPGAKERPERAEEPQQPQQPQQTPQDIDTNPSVAQAEGYTASNSTILGRVDQNNRLNLFDSMSAMPQNRVWVTYLPEKRYHTNINVAESSSNFSYQYSQSSSNQALLHERLSQELYRLGAELIVHPGVSIAVQGQFSNINGNQGGYDDVFTNPQIMLKAVLACDCCSILSGTFGVQPEVGTEDPVHPGINETATRLYPGLLYFHDLGDGWFMQDGIQFGVPTEDNQITTFDWAVSFGNWIYRDPCLDRSSNCCCCCHRPTILGVIAQVEFFGKHVLGDERINDVFGVQGLVFEEDRTVVDATAGVQVLCDGGCWVSIAASIPITSGDVKELEGVVTVGHRW